MSFTQNDTTSRLVVKMRQVLQQPDSVLFLGSGVSRWSGLPTWSGLLQELADFMDNEGLSSELVRRELNLNELLQAASYGVDQLTPTQFARFIRMACRVGIAKPHEIHHKLINLPPVTYITTNFDQLIEDSLKQWKPGVFRTVTNRQVTETAEIVQATATHFIFKPQGDVSDNSSIILTREQYRTLHGEKKIVLEALKTLLVSRPVIFIGFGLRDVDFLYVKDVLANVYAGSARDHYAITANVTATEQAYWRKNFGIHMLSYDAPPKPDGKGEDHSELLRLLDDLLISPTSKVTTLVPKHAKLESIEPEVALALARYAARIIRKKPSQSEFLLPLQVSSQRLREADSIGHIEYRYNDASVDQYLATFPMNTLLLGNPGAGKTYSFLRYCSDAAQKLQDICLDERAQLDKIIVPIYLDLKLYNGQLWEMAQAELPPAMSLQSLCNTGQVQFFVDAVNEVPREYWERGIFEADLENWLKQIGPCRVIFGSRHDDGLKKFGLPTFYLEEISFEFVENYLQQRKVQLKGILQKEVIRLLQKPLFFRLYHENRIHINNNAHPRGLYESFFDSLSNDFVDKFGARLELVDTLSPLAFQAIDSGQETFSLAQITQRLESSLESSIDNTRVLNHNIERTDIINWLVSQHLLVPATGIRLSFYHQNITEFLAAKELANLYKIRPGILGERLRYTRWDQALFLTLTFLDKKPTESFIKQILTTDLELSIHAVRYLEFSQSDVVTHILNILLDENFELPDKFRVGMSLRELPVSRKHRSQLWRLLETGDEIGAIAGIKLLEILDRKIVSELLEEIYQKTDDWNFCQTLMGYLWNYLTDDDVASFLNRLSTVVVPSNKIPNEMGIVRAAEIVLHDKSRSFVESMLGSWQNLKGLQQEALYGWLEHDKSEDGFSLLTAMIKHGVRRPIFALHLRLMHQNEQSFLWPYLLDEALVDRLIEAIVSSEEGEWAVGALENVCGIRSDLSQRVKAAVVRYSGINRAALLYALGKESLDDFWFTMEELANAPISPANQDQWRRIQSFSNLSWANHCQMLNKLFHQKDKDVATYLLGAFLFQDLTDNQQEIASVIEPLDWWWQWMSEIDYLGEDWSFCDDLAGFLIRAMLPKMQETCVENFNTHNYPYRAILCEHILWRLPQLTSDKLNDDAISYLLADMTQREHVSFRGFLLGHIATEQFVETKLLPLLVSSPEPLKSNLMHTLVSLGGRHRRRYITLEDQKEPRSTSLRGEEEIDVD